MTFHRQMNQIHTPQQVQIEKDHCAQREDKGGKGRKNLFGQTADGQSDPAAYGEREQGKKNPVPCGKGKWNNFVKQKKTQKSDYKFTAQKPPEIAGYSVFGNKEKYKKNTYGKSGQVLKKAKGCFAQSVQDTGKGCGQVQEGADKRERPDKNSGVFISKEEKAGFSAEKEKGSGGKNSQDQAVLYCIFHGEDDHVLIAFGLFFGDCGKQQEGDCIGDCTGEED